MAGVDRPFIRKLLGEFAENAVTLTMLEERNFKPVAVMKDFGS